MRRQSALLKEIKQTIMAVGGRIAFGHALITESPNWFSVETRQYFKDRNRWNVARRIRTGRKERKDIWPLADVQYVLDHFGLIKTSRIGTILSRSSDAVRLKFAEVATDEQKVVAAAWTNKSRRSSNFKYNK